LPSNQPWQVRIRLIDNEATVLLKETGLLGLVQRSKTILALDVTASLWAGGGLARTPLHADQTAVVIIQLAGSKTFLLSSKQQVFASVQAGKLPPAVHTSGTTADFMLHGNQAHVFALNHTVAHSLVQLREGQALFIPAGYYHDVQYEYARAAVSVSFRFSGLRFAVEGGHEIDSPRDQPEEL
jgi:hypothetical protein